MLKTLSEAGVEGAQHSKGQRAFFPDLVSWPFESGMRTGFCQMLSTALSGQPSEAGVPPCTRQIRVTVSVSMSFSSGCHRVLLWAASGTLTSVLAAGHTPAFRTPCGLSLGAEQGALHTVDSRNL